LVYSIKNHRGGNQPIGLGSPEDPPKKFGGKIQKGWGSREWVKRVISDKIVSEGVKA